MYYSNSDVRIEELAKPGIGENEMLVKILASGICGSDVMEWYRLKKAPLVLGHEIAGVVVDVGKGVERFQPGDRVIATHHVPCNSCHYCLRGFHTLCDTLRTTKFDPGGFAEYVRLPAINVDRGTFNLPDEVSFEVGTFVEPLGCVVRGLRVARLEPGQTVLVLGSGLSGLLNIASAGAMGARRIVATDISDYRLNAAMHFGASVAIDARQDDVVERALQANENRGFDLAIICAAAPIAFEQALRSLDRGGAALMYAINTPGTILSFDSFAFWHAGQSLLTTYGASPQDLELAINLLAARRVCVEEMITHRLPLDEILHGFEMVADAQESIKVIIEPWG